MTATPPLLSIAMTVEQLWQRVPGGSGTYIRALAAELVETGAVDLVGVGARQTGVGGGGLDERVPVVRSALPRPLLYESWNRLRRPRLPRTREMRDARRQFDVVHATTWAVPPRTAPLVVTVHDLAFLRAPEHFTPRGAAFFRRALAVTRSEADIVVVPSRATYDDCVDAGVDEDRLRLIYHGTDTTPVSAEDVAAFREQSGLRRDYVLWCGTLEPRKNVPALLRAFERLLARGADLDLVLVGPTGWGTTSDDVRSAVAALPPDRVHALGSLTAADLHRAYAGARVFCFPSSWEGFGLPVLEAMTHGTPVVTSRGTSMAEITGDGGILVDPSSIEAIADALHEASGAAHDTLSRGARRAASEFTWRRSAEQHVEAYHAAVVRAGLASRPGLRR